MRGFLIIILLLFCQLSFSQILNVPQFFSPRGQLSTDYEETDQFTALTSTAGVLVPLRTSMGVTADLKGIKGLKDLKEAVKINFSQLMGRLNYRKSIIEEQGIETQYDRYSIALTGVQYRKKFRFLFYQGGMNYHHTQDSEKDGYSFSGLVGWFQVMGLRDVIYYGGVGVYNGKNRLLMPLVGWQHKINSKYSFSLLFPSNVKLTYKMSRKVKLDAMTYTHTLRNQMTWSDEEFRMHFFQFRSGAQVRWKVGKKVSLFTEIGMSYGSKKSIWNEAGDKFTESIDTRPFAKVTLFYNFGKSLFNSGVLDVGIE